VIAAELLSRGKKRHLTGQKENGGAKPRRSRLRKYLCDQRSS
jgi:hypothetical protein